MNASLAVTVWRIAVVLALLAAPAAAQTPAVKKPVTSANDLPVFTYRIDAAPSELAKAPNSPAFAAFAAKVRADIDGELAQYDIRDHATLSGLLVEKMELQLLSGTDDAGALATAEALVPLQDKPEAKLLVDVNPKCIVQARAASGATSGAAYLAAFKSCFARALAPLPWKLVGTALKEQRLYLEAVTPALMIGQIAGNLDAAAAKSHTIDNASATELVRTAYYANVYLPEGEAGASVIAALAAKNTQVKPDIWKAREVTLRASDALTPVRIAIWDSGSDVRLFPRQLYTDPHPSKDTDPHGIAFDIEGFRTHGDLMPLTPAQRAEYPAAHAFLAGMDDLGQSLDTPAAIAMRKKLAATPPAETTALLQKLIMFSDYGHGTHVAGIALRGNPAARLVVGRLTFDYRMVPAPPTEQSIRRDAADDRAYIAYFKAHGVRVVNISWGGTPAGVALALEKNGMGKDAADRRVLAQRLFAIDRAALYDAIKNAPNVLFVCAAGNGDFDTGFNETMPASFDLPNLLVVGAVDHAGDETSFTSYGKTVRVDADGDHIDSVVPGGGHLAMSGTSMATPQVTNLAGKLLAIDPKLTPRETIALIVGGATASSDGRRHNIDPKRSIALLRKELARR